MKKPAADIETEDTVVSVNDRTLRSFHGYQMKRTFNVIQSDLSRTLKPLELRMLTYTALVLIVDNPGLRQSQLAEAMDIERPNLVVIVDELERRGLVLRDRLPNDRRAYALKATAAGQDLCKQALSVVTAHEAALLKGVSPDEKAVALKVLQAIEANRQRDR
ncbi:MarR family transcriptional regulator [Roseibium porphyridii]|uniref:MarR family transcriptional regulator n=1 Tax=Roseibium porphyridii TaxID=2866279 RepID=A0ABY8F8F2_9HYPH|nr:MULTISPECIES: MarR family transcriptional regulator [Stappiaceae]QFT30393.1 Transcriptional regulator SlyA [Labrenzia sp. THAF82]WFE91039.1 MarR family transcriptional regulator [Roseibium sp. KMA01]